MGLAKYAEDNRGIMEERWYMKSETSPFGTRYNDPYLAAAWERFLNGEIYAAQTKTENKDTFSSHRK
ncbi:MAG: hypothetical protein IKU17_02810 [Clostridia bacterium]|nr:hypothetical protein [Clostridia bacterium]